MSKGSRIYLDYNATSPLTDGVAEAAMVAMTSFGNPSSPHSEGRASKALVEKSRLRVAGSIEADPLDIVFTAGGTEANHLGLLGLARASARREILIPPTVHPSLAAAADRLGEEGFKVTSLAVTPDGRIDLAQAATTLASADVAVLAVSAVNHELGTIEDLAALRKITETHGAMLFCDLVQALGRLPVDVGSLGLDAGSISAHKIGGPKGVGALWIKSDIDLRPLIGGGGQERGRRPGTQATVGIAGFAAAVDRLPQRLADAPRQRSIVNHLQTALGELGAITISPTGRVCNTLCVRWPGVAGDLLVSSLDLAGVSISAGAACSSGTSAPSSVLLGIGLSAEEALEAVRFSLGPESTSQQIDELLEILPEIIERAQRFS